MLHDFSLFRRSAEYSAILFHQTLRTSWRRQAVGCKQIVNTVLNLLPAMYYYIHVVTLSFVRRDSNRQTTAASAYRRVLKSSNNNY